VLQAGKIELSEREAHHARDVLRLKPGDPVELFDDAGNVAIASVNTCNSRAVSVLAQAPGHAGQRLNLTVASAVPKGERADWMIEKLSELGVDRFVPLATARGVVLPEGRNKRERWDRLAAESAKQSRRTGVMRIDPLTPLQRFLSVPIDGAALVLSPDPTARSIVATIQAAADQITQPITLLVGPEGGWTADELREMAEAGLTAVRLTETILRVETAAVAAAAVTAALRASSGPVRT
jgi:16S rRNA (uracil1498-N3)-methyltransferase